MNLLLGVYRDRASRSRCVSVSVCLGLGVSRSRFVSVSACLGLGRLGLGGLGRDLGLGRLGLGIDNFRSPLLLITLLFFRVWMGQRRICCPHFGPSHPHPNSSVWDRDRDRDRDRESRFCLGLGTSLYTITFNIEWPKPKWPFLSKFFFGKKRFFHLRFGEWPVSDTMERAISWFYNISWLINVHWDLKDRMRMRFQYESWLL
jgi:hypothetical protein